MRRGVTLIEIFMLMMLLSAVIISAVMFLGQELSTMGEKEHSLPFSVNNRIKVMVELISDLDKRNPNHSLLFYANNPNALQAIENKLNIENKKDNISIHLSKIKNDNVPGIHVSITSLEPESRWDIVKEDGTALAEAESIRLADRFYNKEIDLENIMNNSELSSDDKPSLDGKYHGNSYINHLYMDVVEGKKNYH